MSGDWLRLHRVRGVSSGSPENYWVPWLIHKAKTEKREMEVLQHRTGLTGEEHQSDRCATTRSDDFEAEDMCQHATSRLSKFAVIGHPSDGVMIKISKFALEGHVSLVS
jgi:hypothetical protein